MQELLPRLKTHFDCLQEQMRCFCKYGVQLEGWFKGELLTFLDRACREGWVSRFDREVRTRSGRVDLKIEGTDGGVAWVELKHWLIGEQKGTSYGAAFYFVDPTSVGIIKDVDKLRSLEEVGRAWLLVLLTANPGVESWHHGLRRFLDKFGPRRLASRSDPGGFPDSHFLGLLEVV